MVIAIKIANFWHVLRISSCKLKIVTVVGGGGDGLEIDCSTEQNSFSYLSSVLDR